MAPHCITRDDFLREYVFPDNPVYDFECDKRSAQYASGHPKEWGQDTEILNFGIDLKENGKRTYKSYHSALSPDKKLLAISCTAERILIYDIASKELRQILEGAGVLAFRPDTNRPGSIEKTGQITDKLHEKPAYTIVSSILDEASRHGRENNKLILWDLDQHGRLLVDEEPVDPVAFATKAIEAIVPELETTHEWTKDFINASTLHADFAKALGRVAADHRRRHNTVIDNAELGSFKSTVFSSNGDLLLYRSKNLTTQHGQRQADELPQVVVYDIDAGKEIHRLSGHTDAIMWIGMSPNDQYVSSVSWDGTLRLYSASTGELSWATEDSGGQSWAASFSPDSKYITWSSKNGHVIQVLDVADGRRISTFQETLTNWCRCLQWHPTRYEIVLCAGQHAYVWNVFDGSKANGTTTQHFAINDENNRISMAGLNNVGWMDEGRLLYVESSDGTNLVYNLHTNAKELFRRPKGQNDTAWVGYGFYGLLQESGEQDYYLSVDGDGKARYWRTSVAAFPSWWEKKPTGVVTEKKAFPETGKYVKITKTPIKETPKNESSKDAWAEKGAELWAAE
ncbi:hypothetical protein BKA66DRAFT_427528 [Pyrenochaeta sp. MPI-SDFR-AT-0127]|nr:hypothetical protein BKA66DRAFT_427528 [Pyrenochaeta sp. MPI-SDFR-AT-0127]